MPRPSTGGSWLGAATRDARVGLVLAVAESAARSCPQLVKPLRRNAAHQGEVPEVPLGVRAGEIDQRGNGVSGQRRFLVAAHRDAAEGGNVLAGGAPSKHLYRNTPRHGKITHHPPVGDVHATEDFKAKLWAHDPEPTTHASSPPTRPRDLGSVSV